MYVERIPNRNSPPAILLRESSRDGDKIKKRTLANLSDWPEARVEALRRVLRDEAVAPSSPDALIMQRSLPHGHVAAALGTLRKLGRRGGPRPALPRSSMSSVNAPRICCARSLGAVLSRPTPPSI